MPSGKRQLRSASSDARSSNSPLASGTYIKKESPGGLQSKSCASICKPSTLLLFSPNVSVTNVFTVLDDKKNKNAKRASSPGNLLVFNGNPKNPKASNLPNNGSPTVLERMKISLINFQFLINILFPDIPTWSIKKRV